MGQIEQVCKVKKPEAENNVAIIEETSDAKELLFMAKLYDESTANNIWLINSGCLNHLTSNEHLFTELDKSFKAKVKIGNGVF